MEMPKAVLCQNKRTAGAVLLVNRKEQILQYLNRKYCSEPVIALVYGLAAHGTSL